MQLERRERRASTNIAERLPHALAMTMHDPNKQDDYDEDVVCCVYTAVFLVAAYSMYLVGII